MKKWLTLFIFCSFCLSAAENESDTLMLNFPSVPIRELLHFVSRVSKVNFIYNEDELEFKTSVVSGKPVSKQELVQILIRILKNNQFSVKKEGEYFLIEKKGGSFQEGDMLASTKPYFSSYAEDKEYFSTYKLQFQLGSVLLKAIKQIHINQPKLKQAIDSIQWLEPTNTLVFTADEDTLFDIEEIIKKLDKPKKQVFIEILVIETDVSSGLEFGLEWSAFSKYKDRFVAGINHSPVHGAHHLSEAAKGALSNQNLSLSHIPFGKGLNLGIIGDLILHKGTTFFTLGSLISALQSDHNSTIILNQKIITQDNEQSTIFVGDNIPFTGSVVETIGSSQQTTANIEYRDVGVHLTLTPLLGNDDIITLEIKEEISEALSHPMQSSSNVNGIQTTKTNMVTKVHVPDQHFLVLSGMIRDAKTSYTSGIPCLGGLPLVGAAFSKNNVSKQKRNIIVFVKPQIVEELKEYEQLTKRQNRLFSSEAPDKNRYERGLDLVK